MSNAATRTALVLRDPSVSNSITIRVGSLPAFTDSTLYRSMNFLQVLQSLASSRVSSSSLAVAVRATLPAVVQPEVRRDRDQAEAVGDHLVEEGADALVFLAVLRADRPQVELDVLDRHLRDIRHEDPSQGVRVRRLRLLDEQPHGLRRRRKDLDLHLRPASPGDLPSASCRREGQASLPRSGRCAGPRGSARGWPPGPRDPGTSSRSRPARAPGRGWSRCPSPSRHPPPVPRPSSPRTATPRPSPPSRPSRRSPS